MTFLDQELTLHRYWYSSCCYWGDDSSPKVCLLRFKLNRDEIWPGGSSRLHNRRQTEVRVVKVNEFAVLSLLYIGWYFRNKVDIIVYYDNTPFWISAGTNQDDLEWPGMPLSSISGLRASELTMRDWMNMGLNCQRKNVASEQFLSIMRFFRIFSGSLLQRGDEPE